MKRWISYTLVIVITTLLNALVSCQSKNVSHELNRAEQLVLTNLDSTRTILNQFSEEDFSNEEDKALWAMLDVWAQYRNYEPVIDLKKLEYAFNHFCNSKNNIRRAQVYYLNASIREDQKAGNAIEWKDDMYMACLAVSQTDDHALASKIYQRYEQKLYHSFNYEESINWGRKSREEAQLSGSVKEEITALSNMSLSYLGLEDARVRAEHNIEESQDIAKYTNFKEAFNTAFEALSLAQKYKMAAMEGKIYGNISLFYGRLFKLDSALVYARMANAIDESEYAAGRRRDPVRYLHLSDLYRKLGNVDSALYFARKDLSNPSMITRRNAAFQMYAINYEHLKNYKEALEWKKYHDALTDSINAAPASIQNEIAETAIEKAIANEKSEANKRTAIILLCIVASIAVIFLIQLVYNRITYRKKLQQQENDINELLKENEEALNQLAKQSTETEKQNSTLTLTGNTKEQVEVNVEQVLYITSESNYIKVVYVNEAGQQKQKMVRQTMSNIETQLANYPAIIRCHRAFFVGVDHIVNATSASTGGLMLSLDTTTTKIPVSKTYIAEIKAAIAQNRRKLS